MRKSIIYLLLSFVVLSCAKSNEKSDRLHVAGNCFMCKETIEKSLTVDGVYSANWNKDSKELVVTYDSILISLPTIATHIAKAGYDNELVKGYDEAYNNLHSCCQYERE